MNNIADRKYSDQNKENLESKLKATSKREQI